MIQEFKEFAVKGNAMDLAVGVIIGGAFGKIVDSIVGDLIMPLVSRVVGKLDFSNLFVVLGDNPNNLATLADLKKAGIRGLCLRLFPDHRGQFRHPGLHHLHDGQADESPAQGRGSGPARKHRHRPRKISFCCARFATR
jgi:hypothetical protein